MSQLNYQLAKTKTILADTTITGGTNAGPIVITSVAHGYETGDMLQISGVVGLTAANGQFVITKLTADTYSLNNSKGNAAYSSGGTASHIGFACAALLVDNTVFASGIPDFTIQGRLESLTSGGKVRIQFTDAADSSFVTEQSLATFQHSGAIAVANDKMFTVKKYDVPDARFAASGDNSRMKVFISGGAGVVAQFSGWITY